VAVLPNGSKAYITNEAAASTTVIDGTTNAVIKTIPNTGNWGAAVSPDGTKVYTSGFISNTVSGVAVIDTSSDTVVSTIPITGYQSLVDAISPDGRKLYVAIGTAGDNGYAVVTPLPTR